MKKIARGKGDKKKISIPLLTGPLCRAIHGNAGSARAPLDFGDSLSKNIVPAEDGSAADMRIIQIVRIDRNGLPASPKHALPRDPLLDMILARGLGSILANRLLAEAP
jgi:hypothetical protein